MIDRQPPARGDGRRLTGLAVAALGAVAVAVLAGVLASRIARPADGAKPSAVRIVHAGPARLAVPAGWAPAELRSTGIAGLEARRMAVLDPSPGLKARVVALFGAADDPSLVPAALRAQLGTRPRRPRSTSLGGRPAWAYPALTARGSRVTLNVTVLPTSAGVLAVACTSTAAEVIASDCASAVEAVSVRAAATLQPSPAIALASRLPAVVAELDGERAEGRAALRRARSRSAQAAFAQDLAEQHLAAARSLQPAAGAAWTSVVDGLDRNGRAYTALSVAASDGSTARFASARRAIRSAEATLAGAIDDALAQAGRHTTPAARTARPAADDVPQWVPGELVLVILVVLLSAAVGFVLSGPSALAAQAVARVARDLRPTR